MSEIEGTDLPDQVMPFERNEQQGLTKSSNRVLPKRVVPEKEKYESEVDDFGRYLT